MQIQIHLLWILFRMDAVNEMVTKFVVIYMYHCSVSN